MVITALNVQKSNNTPFYACLRIKGFIRDYGKTKDKLFTKKGE